MEFRSSPIKGQRGQVIVIFVVSLLAMMMLLTLVLDGGMLLVRRREMQVSSDAGALAGVLQLCKDTPTSADYTAARNTALQYAIAENHATNAAVTFPATNAIQVIAYGDVPPSFAAVFGFGVITVEAVARADCAPAGSGSNILPFVFACEPPDGAQAETYEDCVQKIADDPNNPDFPSDYYLVANSDSLSEDLQCVNPPNTTADDPDYIDGDWDCDIDNDGVDDIVDPDNKGWITLEEGEKASANKLIEWITDGFDGEINSHTWIGGGPGTKASVFKAVRDLGPPYPVVLIPIFTSVCTGEDGNDIEGSPEDECAPLWHEPPVDPQDQVILVNGGGTYYHVAGFAAFQITCVHAAGSDYCPYREEYVRIQHDFEFFTNGDPKTIEGYFIDFVSANFGPGIGLNTGAWSAQLTR